MDDTIVAHKPLTGNTFEEGIMHLRREANQICIVPLLIASTVHQLFT
jgi:sirohydrochlorin ferrochelatase